MAMRSRYSLDRVVVRAGEVRPSSWTFGGKTVTGVEQTYHVRDENFRARNEWEFIVRTPRVPGERIEVRPRTTPNVRVWAELPDRSLTFARATLGTARGMWYCQVALADPTGEKSRTIVRSDQRNKLPRWFDSLRTKMRAKEKVRPTRGTDDQALVILVRSADHASMIRLFFATKVWVLKERIALGT